jgi:hypothetical protein
MRKFVILSTDSTREYYDLLPLVCYSWIKLGFTPVINGVNLSEEIINRLTNQCGHSYLINILPVEGIRDSTVAQVSRLFMPDWLLDTDIVGIGDADMVQTKDIFSEHINGDQFISFGFDLTGRSELPMCYNISTAKTWRELIGETKIPDTAKSGDWNVYWSVDQQLLTKKVKEYGFNRIKFVDRGNKNKHGLPTGRWDRHDWLHIPDNIIDIHMKRNDPEAQIKVFNHLWPDDDDSWLRKFLNV